VSPGLIGSAVVLFAVTNVDDIVVLALFYGRAAGQRAAHRRVTAGQFLGFAVIVAISVAGATGARLLPERALPYLGHLLLPAVLIAIGVLILAAGSRPQSGL
jgi:cadmium resistance protein CadD (predicted permease)